jgi:hypothetical protein
MKRKYKKFCYKQGFSRCMFLFTLACLLFSIEAAAQIVSPPTLVSPANGSTNLTIPVTISWSHSSATTYRIQVASDLSFNNLVVDVSGITSTNYQLNLTGSTTYYWRVNATLLLVVSDWSEVWNFSTGTGQTVPSTPLLLSPQNGSTIESLNPVLAWEGDLNADNYRLQVARSRSFNTNTIIFDDSTITVASHQIGTLDYGTQYFWRVNARNNTGVSGWSADWSFTTFSDPNIPSPPILVSPSNGDTGVSVTLTLSWENSRTADSYRLQVSTNSAFSNLIADQSNITASSLDLSGLAYKTQFYWRVNASNTSGTSGWSSAWNFTTGSEPDFPSPPVLVSPQNGAVDESTYPILTWDDVQSAASYQLQVAADESFNNIVFDTPSVPNNYYQVGPLTLGTQYFWRVKSRNTAGVSDWSVVWNFRTRNSESSVPVLISPSDGSRNLPLSVICTWRSIQNMQMYHVQVSTQPDFSTLFLNDSITNNSKQVSGLNSNSTYFWRVRVKLNNKWEQYAAPWQFTTRVSTPSYINIDTSIFFPFYENISDYKSSDYRIIGIPGISHIPVINYLQGTMGNDWQAFWDNGKPENYLVGYNQSDFIFSIGKAFWIIKRGSMDISATTEEAPLNNKGNVEIPLHIGWNLITNPLNYSLSWDSVKAANNIFEPIYSFDGSFKISQVLQSYGGFYFFNSTNLLKLEIPTESSTSKINKENKYLSNYNDIDGWVVNIKIASGEHIDSIAWFGVSSLVSGNFNHLNFHKPRGWGSLPQVYFLRPEWDMDFPHFAGDIKPVFDNLSEWTFEVNSPAWKSVSLTFSLNKIPEHFEIYLFNTVTKRWSNLKKDPVYQFTPVTETTSFKIVAGQKNIIEDKLFVNSPLEFKLGDNFPNPFNLSTTIPVVIPEKSDVEINVYNVLGNRIKTIYKGTLAPGEHWFRWDGTDNRGYVSSSGIYFYHISDNSNINLIKKMTLIK